MIGGIFVVIVGVYIFAQNPVPQIRRNRAGKTSLWQDFASIFGLTIANFIMVIPYILAFFAVFKISGGDMADHTFGGFMRSLFVIAGFFGGAVAWWTLLAFVINLFRRRFRARHMAHDQPRRGTHDRHIRHLHHIIKNFPSLIYSPMSDTKHRIIIAVDGFSSCGKSTLRRSHGGARLGYVSHRHGRHVPRGKVEHGAMRFASDEEAVVKLLGRVSR